MADRLHHFVGIAESRPLEQWGDGWNQSPLTNLVRECQKKFRAIERVGIVPCRVQIVGVGERLDGSEPPE